MCIDVEVLLGDVMCGAAMKPLYLHNHSTSMGNMQMVDCLEN